MAKTNPDRPPDAQPAGVYAIVAARYNGEYVEGLVANFKTELQAIAPGSQVVTHRVPGAFEVPLAVQSIAERGGYDAIAAFGVIIAGATAHADLIATTITQALMQIALARRTPVIHEVLLVRDEAQAQARCLGTELNRGAEAARAAVGMASALRGIRA